MLPSPVASEHRAIDGASGRETPAGVCERQVGWLPGAGAHFLLPEAAQPVPSFRSRQRRTTSGVSMIINAETRGE